MKMTIDCKNQLHELSTCLHLKSVGVAADWILPSEMNGLVELENDLGHEKGGNTIDWLVPMGKNLVSLTQELGFQNIGGECQRKLRV